ncbi:MAG: Fur family transcriptional regulator [Actinomycetota bacterium]
MTAGVAAITMAAQLLRARGERMTRPREAVILALTQSTGHVSADQVALLVAQVRPSAHRASVYRTLERLTELNVVQRIYTNHHTLYHLAYEDLHPHGQCRVCGTIVDLPDDVFDDVRDRLAQAVGFVVESAGVTMPGVCRECRTRSSL